MKYSLLMMPTFVLCLAVVSGCSPTVNPCDVLVPLNPKPETNKYLVSQDRQLAVGIARIRGYSAQFKCFE